MLKGRRLRAALGLRMCITCSTDRLPLYHDDVGHTYVRLAPDLSNSALVRRAVELLDELSIVLVHLQQQSSLSILDYTSSTLDGTECYLAQHA